MPDSPPRRRLGALPLLVVAITALASMGGACPGPSNNPGPPTDTCDQAGAATATKLELGGDDETQFKPWSDGQVASLQFGGQGGRMVVVRLRAVGTVPECMTQHTSVTLRGNEIGVTSGPVKTYPDGDGRATKDIYNILSDYPESGSPLVVTSTAGGATVTRTIYLDFVPDAGLPDGGLPDAD